MIKKLLVFCLIISPLLLVGWTYTGFKEPYIVKVALGLIPGATLERNFGSIDSIQSDTPANIWEYGVTSGAETQPFCADGVACIDTFSSSDVNDTALLTVVGLDINGNEVTQSKAVDGQNKATLDTALWRINSASNDTGTDYEGNIYIYEDTAIVTGIPTDVTTVHGYISIGESRALQATYTVPAGKTAFLVGIEASFIAGLTPVSGPDVIDVNIKDRVKNFGQGFATNNEFNLVSKGGTGRVYNLPMWLPFSGKTDLVPLADVSFNGVGVSWAYTVLLIDF